MKSNPSLRIESNSYNIVRPIMLRLNIDLPQNTLKKFSSTVLQHTQDHRCVVAAPIQHVTKIPQITKQGNSFVNKLKSPGKPKPNGYSVD